MKTCPKCGRANDATRKFCVRCGASLLQAADTTKPKTAGSVPESGRVTIGGSIRAAGESEEATSGKRPTAPEVFEFVRPSEVERNRVRPVERHTEKTELEKAQDAFTRSDTSGHDDRMVRASEIRELVAEAREMGEEFPSTEKTRIETIRETEDDLGTGVKSEAGREALRLVLEKVKEAEALAKKETSTQILGHSLTMERPSREETTGPTLPKAAEFETAPSSPVEKQSDLSSEKRKDVGSVPFVARAVAPTADDEYLRDEKIRKIELDIGSLRVERQKRQSDLEKTHVRLDAEVQRYGTAADAKRYRVENAERDLRLAKKELDDADKECKSVEALRKKELSTAAALIDEIDKQTRKAEEAKRKRIEEIEKEKQKLAK